ncbi:MAG TPA: SDR family oxidoreductase [Dehalococcoidia bacterium]|nr:SDR family oxidoreductase [Dehalococcoidia bacterium]
MDSLRGMNAIITGASRGIGVYIAEMLAAEGVNLALAARSAEGLEATRARIAHAGVRTVAVPCDVTSRDDLQRLVDTAERELGPIDILINNAGIEATALLVDLSLDEIDGIIQTNLRSTIWLTRMVLPAMLDRRRGAVVNVASMAGKVGVAYESIYAATKHGVVGFTRSIRQEIEGSGVTIGVVCPTFVSGAGMWVDADAGRAPLLAREVSPRKVGLGVMKALRGQPEVLVTFGPIRPLVLLFEAVPSIEPAAMRLMGVTSAWKRAAARNALRRKPGEAARR